MQEQEAVDVVLERLVSNGDQARAGYARASMGCWPETETGAQWFFDRMQEYRNAEYALREGNRQLAITLLNSLINTASRVDISDIKLRQGRYPLIPLRDGLLGIDTPVEPEDPEPVIRRSLFDRLIDRFIGV